MNKFMMPTLCAFSGLLALTAASLEIKKLHELPIFWVAAFILLNLMLIFFSAKEASQSNFTRLLPVKGWATYLLIAENAGFMIYNFMTHEKSVMYLMISADGVWLLVIAAWMTFTNLYANKADIK